MKKKSGSYKIEVHEEEKIVAIEIIGTFVDETADSFHRDYLNIVRPVPTKDFILKVDGREMQVIEPSLLPKLQISLALYKSSNFKEIHFHILKELDIKLQLQRVIFFAGLENYHITIDEE